jgi:signal recognition particle subunit SRP54
MMNNEYDLNDLYTQFEQMKKMGSLKDLVGMIPGASGKVNEDDIDDTIIDHNMAIISSMTKKERKNPKLLDASRRKRIATGAGVSVADVNKLMQQYETSAKLMKQMSKGGGLKIPRGLGGMKGLGGLGGLGMGGLGGLGMGGSKGKKKPKKKKGRR